VENVRKIDAKVNAKYLLGDSVNADVNDERWKNVDFVFNAAGFNEQRKAVDERAVFFCKPVVDCGIYEASGHTSDNVPFIAEPCNAAMFTPKSFPGKWSFPRTVEQCAAFAHHIFDYNYWQCPEAARTYEKTQDNRPGLFPRKKILKVFQKPPKDFEDCVRWARKQFEKIFRENISRLLRNFPLDYVDEVGIKFWSGSKRMPVSITFDAEDPIHFSFIESAAILRAEMFEISLDECTLSVSDLPN
jgi:ubiquitin-activating enzyme E1